MKLSNVWLRKCGKIWVQKQHITNVYIYIYMFIRIHTYIIYMYTCLFVYIYIHLHLHIYWDDSYFHHVSTCNSNRPQPTKLTLGISTSISSISSRGSSIKAIPGIVWPAQWRFELVGSRFWRRMKWWRTEKLFLKDVGQWKCLTKNCWLCVFLVHEFDGSMLTATHPKSKEVLLKPVFDVGSRALRKLKYPRS